MIQYILPAVLAFVVGLLLWSIKKDRLALEYDVVESDLFPRDGGVGKYFVCALRNTGNRAVENISLKVEISEGTIDSIEYSDSRLFTANEQTKTIIQGIVLLLNPKERISAIITIKDAKAGSYPKVEARAVGVTAIKKGSESIPEYFKTFVVILGAGVTVLASFSVYNTYTQSKVNRSIEKIGDFKALTTDLV